MLYIYSAMFLILTSIMVCTIEAKKPKIVHCHVCSNKDDIDCDFIHNRFTKFLTPCNDTVDEDMKVTKAKCVVQQFRENRFPLTERKCGPLECPSSAKCCECSKTGCNGENDCHMVFSTGCSLTLSKFLTFLGVWIYSFVQP